MDEQLNLQGNAEIDAALKEFEAKSSPQAVTNNPIAPGISSVPKMPTSGISFDTDNYRSINKEEVPLPKMVKLVMKLSGGAIKEQRQAEYVLLGFVAIIISISVYLFFGANGSRQSSFSPSTEQMMKAGQNR